MCTFIYINFIATSSQAVAQRLLMFLSLFSAIGDNSIRRRSNRKMRSRSSSHQEHGAGGKRGVAIEV